jgi:hypothetical protein
MATTYQPNQKIFNIIDAPFVRMLNTLFTSDIPPVALKVLGYLLSKPSGWNANAKDISQQTRISQDAASAALKWLKDHKYAYCKRQSTGHTCWYITNKPEAIEHVVMVENPELKPHWKKPDGEISAVYKQREEVIQIKKQQQETAFEPEFIPEIEPVVVFSYEEKEYPEQLTQPQKQAAQKIISQCPLKLQDEVLFALAYYLATGKVNNPIGYLTNLVKAANNGTFESIRCNLQTKKQKIPEIYERFGFPDMKSYDDFMYQKNMQNYRALE